MGLVVAGTKHILSKLALKVPVKATRSSHWWVWFLKGPQITGLSVGSPKKKKKEGSKGKEEKKQQPGLISDVITTRGCQNWALMGNY